MLEVEVSNADALMRQAKSTAHDYMLAAEESINEIFGKGYALKHPELIAAFMRTAAQDFHTAVMKVAAQDIREVIDALTSAITGRQHDD